MPNYLQTVIYKIEHKENKELVYVGSTTNFMERKYQHKSRCNNENGKKCNCKLYVMIRENGDWDSFEMLEIKKFPCNNKREAELEEERCRVELKATMNKRRAFSHLSEREQQKQWYEENKEKILEQQKIRYEENKQQILEQQKDYRDANREQIREKDKSWYDANRELILKRKKERYEAKKHQRSIDV